jgi:glycosyltransferase involved in cell wall biosynthesis
MGASHGMAREGGQLKKLLMVAYHYPPEGSSSGVLRTLKFSKYLPQNGWTPHVLTVSESMFTVKDLLLLDDIPGEAVIHRTFAFDSGRHLSFRGHYLACTAVPDRFVGWFPFGVIEGLRVIRKAGIDAIYSTSPSPTAHLIAAALKSISGLPWIADFRDPWIERDQYPVPGTLRYKIESRLEQVVVRTTDQLTVTTSALRDEFLARYADLAPSKVRVIYNGYDEADFGNLQWTARRDRFEILHAGLVTPDFRDPLPLLESVAKLIADKKLSDRDIRVTFLGGGAYVLSKRFAENVKRLGLETVVEVAGRVAHREALERLGQAAVLLLLQASEDTRCLVPAKLFEYIRIGRPVLALVLDGSVTEILKTLEYCYIVNPADHSGIRRTVMTLYQLWKERPEGIYATRAFERYDRSKLTAELAGLLDKLVKPTTFPVTAPVVR